MSLCNQRYDHLLDALVPPPVVSLAAWAMLSYSMFFGVWRWTIEQHFVR